MLEEQKISLEAGEFMHTIANHLKDGTISIAGVTTHHAKIIMEISEVLRMSEVNDAYTPLLSKEGFSISQFPRSTWIDLACRLLESTDETPVSEVIKQAKRQ